MFNKKSLTVNRVFSMVLALLMILSMLPTTAFASTDDNADSFTVCVKDSENDSVINDADIAYKVLVDEKIKEDNTAKTDKGTAVISEMKNYEQDILDGKKVTFEYSVSADGYTAKTDKVDVTDVTGNVDVKLDKKVLETVSVTVNKKGNGTVKINDEETDSVAVEKNSAVKLEVIPEKGTYIKELVIGSETKTVEKGKSYVNTFAVSQNLTVKVTFVKEYSVNIEKSEGGSVKLGEDSSETQTFDEGEKTHLNVAADNGYQISSVSVDGKNETVRDTAKFDKDITVNGDIKIKVEFVKVYTVKVYCNENGTVSISPNQEHGSVTVKKDGRVTVTAVPDKNFRVSSVMINDEKNEFADNRYTENKPYKWYKDSFDTDYEITITFAPTVHKVTVAAGEHGSASSDVSVVNYGDGTVVSITADKGYMIDEVKVNETDKTSEVTRTDANTYKLSVDNITDDTSVSVSFKAYSEMKSDDYRWNKDDAIRSSDDGNTFVFKKDAKVTFSTEKYGIELLLADNTGKGGYGVNSVDITETSVIKEIIVYKDNNETSCLRTDNLKVAIDTMPPTPDIEPAQENEYGYYNSDFDVVFKAEDSGDYSGISTMEYSVFAGGDESSTPTQSGTVYSHKTGEEISQNIKSEKITIDAQKNNCDNVKIVLTVTDLAGNEAVTSKLVNINTTPPTVEVSIDDNRKDGADSGYYTKRTVTVTIKDRATTFNKDRVVIKSNEKPIDESMISEWENNGDEHTAKVTFADDGSYKWSLSYTNNADLKNDGITTNGESVFEFVVDNSAPSLSLKYKKNTWSEIVKTITFGIWGKSDMKVSAIAEDAVSPIKSVLYYKSTNNDTVLNESELNELYKKGEFSELDENRSVTVSDDERFVIYARAEDYAGNYTYVSSNGMVVDKTPPTIELECESPNVNEYYNKDVKVKVKVDEGSSNCSGIKSVKYNVYTDDKTSVTQPLYEFESENPTKGQLKQSFEDEITVNSKTYNSDNVRVVVTAEDNAGNPAVTKEAKLKINSTAPTVSVKFDNNNPNMTVGERGYYSSVRTATVTIKDRATTFDENAAMEHIVIESKKINGDNIEIDKGKMISEWKHNGDEHTAKVTFADDGNYNWSLSYTNLAGLKTDADKVDVSGQKNPYEFTVDKSAPSLKLRYENNAWDKLLETLTFGIWKSDNITVSEEHEDTISPIKIKSVSYYKSTDNDTAFDESELDDLYKNGKFSEFDKNHSVTVSNDEMFVIYARAEDYAGNTVYVSSNGMIVDTTPPTIDLKCDDINEEGYGYKDVKIKVNVEDKNPNCSGISWVKYQVDEDEPVKIHDFNVENPTKDQLKQNQKFTGEITVNSSKYNHDNVTVVVTAGDNAGNLADKAEISFNIDTVAPKIKVKYDDEANQGAKNGYYTKRTATVTITERSFDSDAVNIDIGATDVNGRKVTEAYKISGWTTTVVNENNHDEDIHTATIEFKKDANYTFDISCTDKAGNKNQGVEVSGQNPYEFTVDKTSPKGSLKAKSAEGQEVEWSELRKSLTFGFWSNKRITVTGSQSDDTSPIAKVEYYKVKANNASDGTTPLTEAQLNSVTSWTDFKSLDIRPNEQCTVYVKITDYAGNYTYISTNGLIVDNKKPREEAVAPKVTVNPQQPVNGFYRGNVGVSISVNDPLTGGTYSGLKEVSYRVYSQNRLTQEGVLYSFNNQNPKQSDLKQKWTGSITVDSAKNNSNDVRVVVYAKDNAGNDSEGIAKIKIDTTAPRIDISYDNNSADSNSFFKSERTARIVVTERNFNPDDVAVKITNTDGVIPKISGWTKIAGTGNQDDTRWTATVRYSADGDYKFSIAYTDLAGNKCSGENYATGTVAAKSFTIDRTAPTVTVSYNNNSARNGNYYNADRTATITVIEHNFDVDRVNVSLKASDDGKSISLPSVSGWISIGNQHTATITYNRDGQYTFDIAVKDKAGNDAADFNAQTFTIDKTAPTLAITGVENNSANSGDIIPVVSYADTNYDDSNVSIKLTGANRKNVELNGYYSEQHNGKIFTFRNFAKEKDVDDIYTLTANLTDRAGNTSSKTIIFSANRFGSTYAFDSSMQKLNGSYAKSVKDISVTETNVNKLSNIKITLFKNNETILLKNGSDYKIDVEGGNGKWYKYVYTIFSKNFEDDGVYRLSFHSEDAAGNVAENTLDTKDKEISFGVDKTKPTVILNNLESGKTYPLEKLKVSLSANDNLLLDSVTVYLDNYSKAYKTWDSKEIADILAKNGEFLFDVSGNSTGVHNVKVICKDAAGNTITKEATDFYVTTNLFVRYYNNKLLFFGSIGGLILIICAIVYIVIRKKKSKENSKGNA